MHSSTVFSDDAPTAEQDKAERDYYVLQLQPQLDALQRVNEELRRNLADYKESMELHSVEMEEKEVQLEQLRSENEGLRQDLGFEYSELLFLKLQMKAIECDVADLRDEKDDFAPSTEAEKQRREKKNHILSEMDRWRTDSDWQDVEARFKRRRSRYGIPTSPIRKDSKSAQLNAEAAAAGDIEWQLETERADRGRVTSLTIKRMDSSQTVPRTPSKFEQPVTLNGTTESHIHFPDMELTPKPPLTTPPYSEIGTQTEVTLLSPFTTSHSPLDGDDHIEQIQLQTEEQEEEEDDNDCAITTSASSEADGDPYQDVEEDEETVVSNATLLNAANTHSGWRIAAKELWTSLQNLSGFQEDDEEEDD